MMSISSQVWVRLVCGLCLAAMAVPVSAADWTQWRGPGRTATVESGSLPTKLEGGVELAWEKPLGPSYSGPIVFDGMIYTTETVDRKNERVTAFDLSDGSVAWTAEWPGAMAVPFFAASNGDWIRATPAVSKDGLVVAGMRDRVVCLDPKTGAEKWVFDPNGSLKTPLPMFGCSCSPLIDGDAVYMQTGGCTVRLNLKDGEVVWKTLDNSKSGSPGAFASPAVAELQGKRQLLVQTRVELCGVDMETGAELWKQPIQSFRGMNILTPTVIGNRIFNTAHSGAAQLFEIKESQGEWGVTEKWNHNVQGYMSSPVVIGDRIFVHLKNQRLVALDAATGETSFSTAPIGKYASMITDGKDLLMLTNDGDLMLIDGATTDGKPKDELKVADDSWAHLGIVDDYLLVRDLEALKVFKINR
ncbi:MAG: hypothetical protein CBB71_09900 [Rhodopirellula sp. TMED11]|nr:MAG: hypothetical protein CBB71_09900 [Rhodopirellula sp. TMED11]